MKPFPGRLTSQFRRGLGICGSGPTRPLGPRRSRRTAEPDTSAGALPHDRSALARSSEARGSAARMSSSYSTYPASSISHDQHMRDVEPSVKAAGGCDGAGSDTGVGRKPELGKRSVAVKPHDDLGDLAIVYLE